jgi:hypothetical protein
MSLMSTQANEHYSGHDNFHSRPLDWNARQITVLPRTLQGDRPRNSSGGWSPTSHPGGASCLPGQFIWDLWWGRFSPSHFSVHKLLDTHLPPGAGAIGPTLAGLPSGLNLIPPPRNKKNISVGCALPACNGHERARNICRSLDRILMSGRRISTLLRSEFRLNNTSKSSPYLTGNTLRLRYKTQPVTAV